MKIVLPLPPNLANGRMHWRTKEKKRRDYRGACGVWVIQGLQSPPAKPWKRARITRATLYVFNRMDYDNMVARLKWPVDFLVQWGFIVDDGPDHLEWGSMPSQEVDRKRPRVVIELEQIA